MSNDDIDEIYHFIARTVIGKNNKIAFYGGEPMLQYPLVQYAIETGRKRLGDNTSFSIATNATLLTPERIDWLIDQGVDISISIDGTESYHDSHRVYGNGMGSFEKVRNAIMYITNHHPEHKHLVSLQMTIPNYREIEGIAETWSCDEILKQWEPSGIHGLATNSSRKVKAVDFEELRLLYEHLLDVYEEHRDWSVLKVLFKECVTNWYKRPIMDVVGAVPMTTCVPMNPRLYIDTNKQIAVCEKISDHYRIGSVGEGIDWQKANELVQNYYNKRVHRCAKCPAIRMCNLCLTAVEFNDEQWDVLCHNECVYARLDMLLFCEMAERRMIA